MPMTAVLRVLRKLEFDFKWYKPVYQRYRWSCRANHGTRREIIATVCYYCYYQADFVRSHLRTTFPKESKNQKPFREIVEWRFFFFLTSRFSTRSNRYRPDWKKKHLPRPCAEFLNIKSYIRWADRYFRRGSLKIDRIGQRERNRYQPFLVQNESPLALTTQYNNVFAVSVATTSRGLLTIINDVWTFVRHKGFELLKGITEAK